MDNRISARQLCVAAFTGLLAPAAAAAGGDWRGALLAVPVVVLAVWAGCAAAARPGGLSALLRHGWGKVLALLYIVWGVLPRERGWLCADAAVLRGRKRKRCGLDAPAGVPAGFLAGS